MKHDHLLIIMSLLSFLLITLHFTDDMVRGISTAGPDNVFGIVILVVWLSGPLLFRGRVAGYVIMLLAGIFAAGMPVIHMRGASFPEIIRSSGGFFFFWTLYMLGVTGVFSIILSVVGLWGMRARKSP